MKGTQLITGAEAVMRSLINEGVTRIFGYPGGSIMPVYNALFDHRDEVTHVLTRHEQGAIHAAQGYARVTGKPGVVFTTSGPGATNLVTGIADALADSTPLVIVTGQVDSNLLGFDAFQETDVVGVTLPVAKWSCQIWHADEVGAAVARAFHIACTGRPGPVIIDITVNAQNELTEYFYTPCSDIRSYDPSPLPDAEAIREAAALINSSRRPLIIAGQGVTISSAEVILRELAEKADIPVGCTLMGLSAMPSDHRLNRGMVGMHGRMSLNVNTNRSDLILAVGMRFDNRVTGCPSTYAPNAKIVHIDIDSTEFDKIINADVKLHGDALYILNELLPLVREASHSEWISEFDRIDADEQRLVIDRELKRPEGMPMSMAEVVTEVMRQGDDTLTVVTDVGLNQMMAARYSRFSRPRSIVTSGGLGTMGFGLPAAIGAKMGCPASEVVLFVGDGGLQMTIQELGTILENGTVVKIVLLNNNFLGNVRQLQTVAYGGRFSATPLVNPDFVAISRAYGIEAENVNNRTELAPAVTRLLGSGGSYLINVNIDENDMVFPMMKTDVDCIMVNLNEIYKIKD